MESESTRTTPSHSTTERVKRFFDQRDWKFYCALAAGVGLVGAAGAYYYYSTISSGRRRPRSPTSSNGSNRKFKAPTADKTTTPLPAGYEDMSSSAIANLSEQQRAEAANALKLKGNTEFTSKRWDRAAALYTKALEFKEDPVYYSNRAACFANLGETDRVLEDCNKALTLNPLYIKAVYRRAHALELKEELEAALYDFTCVCILDGFRNEAAARAMESLLKRVSAAKAAELIKTKNPKLPSSAFVGAYFDSFRPDTSRAMAAVSPNEETADGYYSKTCDAMKHKRYDEALKACERAIDAGCSEVYLAHALNIKGTFLFLKGDTEGALTCFNRSIDIDPKYVQSYIKRSSVYMEQGNVPEAFNQFDEALSISASNPDIFYHRITEKRAYSGQINFICGKFEDAAKDYSESIKLDDTFVYAYIQLGVAQYKSGSTDASTATFNRALSLFPHSSDLHNYYGELLADQQKLPEALEMFTKAIELDSSSPLPYVNKAMLMYQSVGDVKQAIDLCKKALDVDPACDAAVASLAQMLLEQGEPEEALRYYETAIDLARTEAELQHAISYVEATKAQVRFTQDYPQAASRLEKLRKH
ncbi:import receptor [Lichtheimia corymbifera JMRC:FSU:9682]|uniref:Import receptor n=1 Tax=Lichtheimia corymbifera JMRC:FSU:9682 TaxID=1263082 RepID=A0A068RJ38_9FUNG|nr:import receptor [Lichtheimia corymbifera JMRC:FSU:9682]